MVANRLIKTFNQFREGDEVKLLDNIKNLLDLKASGSNEFGISIHPL
jgi:hypothetical protein